MMVYDDFSAGKRAALELTRRIGTTRTELTLVPTHWRLGQLADESLQAVALAEAAAADLIIIATALGAQIPPAVEEWFRICRDRSRLRDIAIVILAGDEERRTFRLWRDPRVPADVSAPLAVAV
jgi:hypothetical protein